MARIAHTAACSTSEWVAWAHTEGMVDFVEDAEDPGVLCLVVNSVGNLLFLGKVYYLLCCKKLVPSSDGLKVHCYGAKNRKTGEFVPSQHAKKVQKRKEREEAVPQEPAPVPSVIINVCW